MTFASPSTDSSCPCSELKAGHERHGHHHDANDGHAGHRHRGEERHRRAVDWFDHHRPDRRRIQIVHARGHRQARREDHARGQAGDGVRLPSRRYAERDHHYVEAAAGHDREGSAGDARDGHCWSWSWSWSCVARLRPPPPHGLRRRPPARDRRRRRQAHQRLPRQGRCRRRPARGRCSRSRASCCS